MLRSTVALRLGVSLMLVSLAPSAPAQTVPVIPGNLNDLTLANGTDIIYIYDDPSIGPGVGTSGVPDFATNTYFWKVMSRDVLRHASGTMEVTGISVWNFDGDYVALEGPNNTALPDVYISRGIPASSPFPAQVIEPDQADPNAAMFSFGPGGPKNNVFLPSPGCFVHG